MLPAYTFYLLYDSNQLFDFFKTWKEINDFFIMIFLDTKPSNTLSYTANTSVLKVKFHSSYVLIQTFNNRTEQQN